MSKPDNRIRDFIQQVPGNNPAISLAGFPSDEGVRRNGGRPGAAQAPDQIYAQLLKLTPHARYTKQHTSLFQQTAGLRNVPCSGHVEADQEMLGKHVASQLASGILPLIIGGGHETAYGHFLGYVNAGKPVTILNIDAHADVRPLKEKKAHSGSPFYQAVKHNSGLCNSYNVFGLNPSSVAAKHVSFVKSHGISLFEDETTLPVVLDFFEKKAGQNIMISMDMDAVDQGDAPGVSAPNAAGLSKQLWLALAFEFGKCPAVTSFDLCEVNPVYDRDHQTVKLAALTVWYFLLGVALRGGQSSI